MAEQTTFGGARSIALDYPNGDRVVWAREIPSNTWRGRVVAVRGEARPKAEPFLCGMSRDDLAQVLMEAMRTSPTQATEKDAPTQGDSQ